MGSLRSLRRNKLEPIRLPKPTDQDVIQTVKSGTVKELKALLERGANPNAVEEHYFKNSALGHAILKDRWKMIELLVGHGADVNHGNDADNTCLHLVSSQRRAVKIASILLDHGADLNATNSIDFTPLMFAVLQHEFNLARLMLEKGADPKFRNSQGRSAADYAGYDWRGKSMRRLLGQFS